jgi:hypothetical protein
MVNNNLRHGQVAAVMAEGNWECHSGHLQTQPLKDGCEVKDVDNCS